MSLPREPLWTVGLAHDHAPPSVLSRRFECYPSGPESAGVPYDGVVTDRTDSKAQPLKVLVYSDDSDTREQVVLALGKRPHPDLPRFEYVECATEPVVIKAMDTGDVDLAILDGEAVPAGGMGVARQLKTEIYRCPPLLVLTGRAEDAWLATWSLADGVVAHPIDPIVLADVVFGLVREAHALPATS